MRLLVCGDRNWTKVSSIMSEIRKLRPEVVIHGMARGADIIAGECARELGIKVLGFPAQWDLYGRSAGPRRNEQMLRDGKPDYVLAFHANIGESKGTAHMLKIAQKAGVRVRLVTK